MAVWVGVDVGGKRKGFDVAVIDDRRVLALQGHLTCREVVNIVNALRASAADLAHVSPLYADTRSSPPRSLPTPAQSPTQSIRFHVS